MDKITIMSDNDLDLFISDLFDEVTLTEVIINDFVDVCLNQICTWIFLCDEIALPEIWKSDVRKWKSSMRVYSRNVLSRPYTSRMDLSCSASMLVMLI